MGDRDNSLNAFTSNPDGSLTLMWTYNHGYEGDIWQNPVIAPAGVPEAGTIYFAHDQCTDGAGIFTALKDNGASYTVKWKYKIGNFVRQSSPAIDDNGIIYFGDLNGYVYAFADRGACPDNGTLRTQPALSSSCTTEARGGPSCCGGSKSARPLVITASPVISADSNTLYIGTMGAITGIPMGLTALDITNPCSGRPAPAPPVKWTFPTIGKVDQTPALGRDGTLYVPAMNGGQKRLYAVTPTEHSNGYSARSTAGPRPAPTPIVGGDDTVYVGLGNSIYALNPATGTTALDVRDDELHPVLPAHRPRHRRPGHPVRALARPQPLRHLEPAQQHHHAHDLLGGGTRTRTIRPSPTQDRINRYRPSAPKSRSTARAAMILTAISSHGDLELR